MANVMKYWNGSAWVPVASQYIDPNYAYLKQIDNPSNRNLLYNGAMQVAQRGTSVTGITGYGYYTADRWNAQVYTLGTWTNSVESDAPTGSGFRKAFKMLCTTSKASPAAGDALAIEYRIEGQDCQRIAKGTPSAQQLTLSFWVKSNVTGAYIAELVDNDNTRSVSAAYMVSASGTWEKKSITFPADTTGVLDNDNANSIALTFWLAAGSNFSSGTLATTWGSTTNANRAVGQTNLAASTNNYWQITGVQLETGPVATPFEFKSYGQELRECQRYYYRKVAGGVYAQLGSGFSYTTTAANMTIQIPTVMRVTPTSFDYGGSFQLQWPTGTTYSISALSFSTSESSPSSGLLGVTHANAGSSGSATFIRANNDATAYIGFSAEL